MSLVAAGVGACAQDGEVPLYTNADLEQFGAPENPVSPPPPAEDAERQWDFVQEHLDREYSRIDADRRLWTRRSCGPGSHWRPPTPKSPR